MKKFIVGSYQLVETKKWAPSGTIFESINGNKINVQEADVFPPEFRFDTKEEADAFFREYFSKRGFTEDTLK